MMTSATPFEFFTVAHLTRIGNQSAGTLAELLTGLEQCNDASIFHHTFQTLGSHHFLTEGFSNDFAQWVLTAASRGDLAEQLAALDVRDYLSIAELRTDLCRLVGEYSTAHPDLAGQSALERFYFCESVEVTLPLGRTATTLDEFRGGMEHLSHAAFYFHFISSRLRLQLQTNDFSYWLAGGLHLDTLAHSINRIDIYTNTIDSARVKILRLIDREREKIMTVTEIAQRIPLEEYASVLGEPEIEELRALAKPLRGRSVQMINSTAVGGGVAEILNRLVPLAEELDLKIRWDVMTGGNDFFEVTKSFHNALHGAPYQASPRDFEIFLAYNEQNRSRLSFDSEFTVIHDPQPVALIDARKDRPGHWIWRCHIDLSRPNLCVWNFLADFVSRYDCSIFSSPDFSRQLPIPQYLFYPSIDPLAEKNRPISAAFIAQVLERYHIDPDRPILTQISRFDRLKDPVGVIRAYRIVKRYFDCQLVLAGGSASDDPEGAIVLKEVLREADNDPDIKVCELPAWAPLEVNALQRASTIVIQKSLREGFGLTVSEALWKKKPVVASAVGGIPIQVIHKHTGLLAHSVEGTAYQIRFLLSHPEIAAKLGEHGHDHVKENFLITHNLKRYLTLFLILSRAS